LGPVVLQALEKIDIKATYAQKFNNVIGEARKKISNTEPDYKVQI
jgi:hypothetical protein